jgi:hypothetical protein
VKRFEAEEALFAVEIGRRNVSFGVMVSVIEFRHVSSESSRLIVSEWNVEIQHGIKREGTSAAEAASSQ